MQDPIATPTPAVRDKRHMWVKFLVIIIVLLLVGVAGGSTWQLRESRNNNKKTATTNAELQKSVDSLTKQLAAAKAATSSKASSTTAASATAATCTIANISQSLKDNLAAAVGSQNYAALVGYMTSSVDVVIAASSKTGFESSTQAVSDMSYLNSASGPWNFNLPASTTDVWTAHSYKQYFSGAYYAGEAASHQVVSYQFDASCTKVNGVFMAADASLLTQ